MFKDILLFDGKMTLEQLIIILVAAIVVGLIIKFVKGTIRMILTVITICVCLVRFSIVTPKQLADAGLAVKKNGVEYYRSFANSSSNIRISGSSLQIRANNEWYSVNDVTAINGNSIIVKGESVPVDDENILRLLETFKK